MLIRSFARKLKYKFVNCIDHLRATMRGFDKLSRVESKCLIRNVTVEGRNHIGKNCQVYNTSIGFASGISRDSIIDSFFIGRYSTFGPDVKIITGEHPTKGIASTYPAFYSARAQMGFTYVDKTIFEEFKYADKKNKWKVIVGNDVWIGSYVKIMEGISIGDGAVVAAGAVVTKDVPPYAIVGGVPAKVIKYRFDEETIRKLLELKWWNKDQEWINTHAGDFDDVNKLIARVQAEQ